MQNFSQTPPVKGKPFLLLPAKMSASRSSCHVSTFSLALRVTCQGLTCYAGAWLSQGVAVPSPSYFQNVYLNLFVILYPTGFSRFFEDTD